MPPPYIFAMVQQACIYNLKIWFQCVHETAHLAHIASMGAKLSSASNVTR